MSPLFYAHPLSSYCQKVLIALYENDTRFTYRPLQDDGVAAELKALWPINRFPVLVDAGRTGFNSEIWGDAEQMMQAFRRPVYSAITGDVIAETGSDGLDFGAMADYARKVGGPALRKLTFHERALKLKA